MVVGGGEDLDQHEGLLTGAWGFIGAATTRAFSEAGHEVAGLDALIAQAHPGGRGGTMLPVDPPVHVRQDAEVRAMLSDVDVVCYESGSHDDAKDSVDTSG